MNARRRTKRIIADMIIRDYEFGVITYEKAFRELKEETDFNSREIKSMLDCINKEKDEQ